MSLLMTRHAETVWHRENRYAGTSDIDLTPNGVQQAERLADWVRTRKIDAIACSPLGKGRPRPEVFKKPVIIEDNVWIGPNATILKGVRIGAGAFVEAGSVVTRDVPTRSRVLGNPAQIIGEIS